MKTVFASLVISAATLLVAGQASATPLTFTYKGTVSSGTDYNGLFGQAGTDLGGKSFEVIETFDVAKISGSYSYPGYTYAYGGANYSAPDFSTSKIKIGSSAFRSIGSDYSALSSSASYNSNYVESASFSYSNNVYRGGYEYTSLWASAPGLTVDNQPTTVVIDGINARGGGYFNSYMYNYDYNTWNFQSATQAYANLNLQSLTIASVSAVPLPASAPMFGAALLGLVAVGFGVRRRKAVAAAA